jgi:hypothetical protein
MPRLLNRGRAAQNRRNTRAHVLATNYGTHMSSLNSLEEYQKQRVNTGRELNRVNRGWEKYSEQTLRKLFRREGASHVLPRSRLKLIAKLRNVYANALAIANAQRQLRNEMERRRANEKRRRARPPNRVTVPSLNVQFAKRTNGREPNMVVVSPQSAR